LRSEKGTISGNLHLKKIVAFWGLKARRVERMFGTMSVGQILSVERGCNPVAAVRSLVERAEGVKVMKWIEFPDSILVFLMVPGDLASGSIYFLDRKSRVWYWVDFEDSQYGGYRLENLSRYGLPGWVAARSIR
jgi:hypothetical protein